jgi:hypothetical protein
MVFYIQRLGNSLLQNKGEVQMRKDNLKIGDIVNINYKGDIVKMEVAHVLVTTEKPYLLKELNKEEGSQFYGWCDMKDIDGFSYCCKCKYDTKHGMEHPCADCSELDATKLTSYWFPVIEEKIETNVEEDKVVEKEKNIKRVKLFTVKVIEELEQYEPVGVTTLEKLLDRAGIEGYARIIDIYTKEIEEE